MHDPDTLPAPAGADALLPMAIPMEHCRQRTSQRPSCYPVKVKVSELLRVLQSDGWYLVATRGSHRQFKHAIKPGRVTVPGKPSDDLAPGTLNSILKQAGLKS